jgi:GTP-binding protein HflX
VARTTGSTSAFCRANDEAHRRNTIKELISLTPPQERAVLVGTPGKGSRVRHNAGEHLAELARLADTAGAVVVASMTQQIERPDPATYVGSGKVEELAALIAEREATLVIFDDELSPAQGKNLETILTKRVVDRAELILDIFATRARTAEAKLQVELAQLEYALPRLIEKNTMMSRLTGGIGGRGPGETKLEINRRRARDRIALLEKKLRGIQKTRQLRRKQRGVRGVPIVAIVGYTNAGKSTLLNSLTQGDAVVADQLFATLDPISRRLRFPRDREIVLTDTVGFIRDLPANLVTAFRATLEELADADLLVHVVDASDDGHEEHIAAVTQILADLDVAETPRLIVFNKADLLDAAEARRRARCHDALAVSALSRSTFAPMLDAIERELWREGHSVVVR